MRCTPLWPRLVASQKRSRPTPLGLTAPIPVITTRRFISPRPGPRPQAALPFPTRQYRLEVMFAANEGRSHVGLRHALAGLQAGMLGALVMLACLMAGSLLGRRSVWVVPNLFATTF